MQTDDSEVNVNLYSTSDTQLITGHAVPLVGRGGRISYGGPGLPVPLPSGVFRRELVGVKPPMT